MKTINIFKTLISNCSLKVALEKIKKENTTAFLTISILPFFIFIFTSCEDVVDVKLSDEDLDLTVVEAYLNTKTENNVYVKIEKTTQVNDTTTNVVNNAVVTLTDNEATPNSVTLEEQGTSGIYLLPEGITYPGVTGRTYTLNVKIPDGDTITGQELLSEVATLDSVSVKLSKESNYDYLGIYGSFQEPEGEGNYYKWDMYVNGEHLNDIDELVYGKDELIDGNYVSDFCITIDWEDDDDEKLLHKGDTVVVEQLSISKEIYDFYVGMYNQGSSGSLFSVPPANVQGNLSASSGKRVLGMFSARDISVGNTVVIDDSSYSRKGN